MTKLLSTVIPGCTWSRPIGLGWDKPYTNRVSFNIDDGPWHGMPLGGFGAGCIGRSSRGDFNLWHIDGGEHTFQNIPACQFSVFESNGTSSQAYALATEPPENDRLAAWKWYPASTATQNTGTYHALYPRSWFVYENVFQAQLTCKQFSPIWAENYQESSYPVAVFEWKAHNPTNAPITLSIMLTWQNMVGWFTNALKSPEVRIHEDGTPVYSYEPCLGKSKDNYNYIAENTEYFSSICSQVRGDRAVAEGDGSWCIATIKHPQVEVFYHTRWNPEGTGEDVWQSFAADGSLPNHQDATPASENTQIATAIALRFTLQPGETLAIPVVLAWDFPVTEFASGINYYRRYTDFFGRGGDHAEAIAATALTQYQTWYKHVEDWQQPIIDREDLPDWLKMALFNELYDLTSGGSLWSAASELDPIGQFAVLECLDYRWYESLDVRLYGSFGLLHLLPELEKAVIRAFARAIPDSDDHQRIIAYFHTIGESNITAARKVAGATPHDLGAPNEHVWEKTNYTCYQDCNLWKDLGCDFVLQVYRDFLLTGADDIQFLADCWEGIVQTLNYLKTFDLDGDGIPENSGAPDQTFDAWRLEGVSAYCGGLWLAALEAAIAISDILLTNHGGTEDTEELGDRYRVWLAQSLPVYQEKLWNGQYFRLDSDSGSQVVMADQLCGQFYARLLGLPDIVPSDRALSALHTVYDACFLKFCNGQLGAANGLLLDGSPEDPNASHPLEIWTGINFGVAAFLVQMGMQDEAWKLTHAVVQQIYNHGLQFRTPEALTASGTFRSSTYLRPMAIWAIYLVIDSKQQNQ